MQWTEIALTKQWMPNGVLGFTQAVIISSLVPLQ